jgi:hypothetical protein
MRRIRKPATISASARCARISLTDHLSGAGRLPKLGSGHAVDKTFELLGRRGLDGQGLLARKVTQYALRVLLGCFIQGCHSSVLQEEHATLTADAQSCHISAVDGF